MPEAYAMGTARYNQTVAPYYARYGHAAVSAPKTRENGQPNIGVMYHNRIGEEFGFRDIWEELATYDDDGMSLTGFLKNAFGIGVREDGTERRSFLGAAAWQAVTTPLQMTSAMAVEANRLAAVPLLTAYDLAVGGEGSPWRNYLTGGQTGEENTSAPGVYKSLTLSDLGVVYYDRLVRVGVPRPLATLLAPTRIMVNSNDGGPMANGSYLPWAWDLTAPDAAQQMDRAGIYESQRAVAQLSTELVLDPMNYAAGPINGLMKARKGFTLIGDSAKVIETFGPAAERTGMIGQTVGSGSALTGAMELDKVMVRAMRRLAGAGLLNPARLMDMLQGSKYSPVIQRIADTDDVDELTRLFHAPVRGRRVVTNPDDARRLAKVAARLTTPEEVLHLFNAAAYRNVHSVAVLDDALADTTFLRNEFRTLLGLQDDIFERAALDFVGEGGPLPKGHILTDNARTFVDEVLDEQPEVREAWDALGDPARAEFLGKVTDQQEAMHSMQRLFGAQGPRTDFGRNVGQVLRGPDGTVLDEGVSQGLGTIEFIPRNVGKWLRPPRVHRVEGSRIARFRPTVLLLDKPGVHFALHGDDAVDKFNDIIRWVDARITSVERVGVLPQVATHLGAYRFTIEHDDDLRRIHHDFLDAGVTTSRPEEARAALMDEFQKLILRRMGQAAGFEDEVAQMVAARAMDRGRWLADSLMDAERGYATSVLEDGRPMFLAAQPSVERQAANYVGLMDWDAAFKAMVAVRKGENAIGHSETELISAATAEKWFSTDPGVSKYANRKLERIGRERTIIGSGAHMIMDLADAVNYIFKTSVLLRLGYTTRNLAEGTASAMASGMSIAELAKYADFTGLVSNTLYNATKIPTRLIDRAMVGTGFRMNDQALLQYAEAHAVVDTMQQDQLHRFIAVVASPRRQRELADIITDASGRFTAEERAMAADGLRWMIEQRRRLALGITADNVALAGPFRPHTSMQASQHLYHADTGGGLQASPAHDPEGVYGIAQDIDAPIRTVDNPVLAHGNADALWTPLPGAGVNVADRLVTLQANVRAAGGGSVFRYTDKAGKQRETTRPATVLAKADPTQPVTVHRVRQAKAAPAPAPPDAGQEFWHSHSGGATPVGTPEQVAAFAVPDVKASRAALKQVAAEAKPGTHIWRGAVVKQNPMDATGVGVHWTANPDAVMKIRPDLLEAGEHQVIWHGVLTGDEKRIDAYALPGKQRPMDWEAEVRFEAGTNVNVVGVSIDGEYYQLSKSLPTSRAQATGAGFVKPTAVPVPRAVPAPPAKPGKATVYAGRQVQLPPPTAVSVAKAHRKTHHVQMRDNPNSLWRPYSPKGVTATSEIRVLDKASHPDGFPKVVSVDTYGAELDLRQTAGVQHALNTYRDVDQAVLDAARQGDRAAQDRLSDIFAGHGIYRIVLPDSRPWGRYQVIVHPKGIGERGFQDAVGAEYESAVSAMTAAQGRSDAALGVRMRGENVRRVGALNRRQIRRLNRSMPERSEQKPWGRTPADMHHLVGEPMTPTAPLEAIDVLRNGGFEDMASELVDAAIRTRRNRYTAQALYGQRVTRTNRDLVKRKGIRDKANLFRYVGAYGTVEHVLPSLLSGGDGAMFGTLASGEASYMMGYAQMGYLTELLHDLEKGHLVPKMVTPEDPRYFDALANLFGRQFRDQPGFQRANAVSLGVDDLDPGVRRLLEPGDREAVIERTTDWALHTEEGRQWVRTLGLQVTAPRRTAGEVAAGREAIAAREAELGSDRPLSRMAQRYPVRANWRGEGPVAVTDVAVGDAVATMSNFLEQYVLHSPNATQALLQGNVTGDALRAAYAEAPWELKPVHGMLSPTTAEARQLLEKQRAGMSNMERVNHGIVRQMSRALNTLGAKPETRMLRHPMFEMVGQADLQQRIRLAETTLGRDLNIEEVNRLRAKSQKFALKKMEQTLYTLSGRGAVDDWARFVMPFFPAWKNAITRWGRMVNETPGSVALLSNRVNAVGRQLTFVNEKGESVEFNEAGMEDTYIVLPGFGDMLERVTKIPGVAEMMRNTRIPLRSMDVMFQGDMLSPGFGPWLGLPAQELLTAHPEWLENDAVKWIVSKVFPVGPTDTGSRTLDSAFQFMPTAIRRLVEWSTSGEAWAGEMDRNMRLLMVLQRTGQMPATSETELKAQAVKLTHLKMSIKLVSSLASPVAQQQRGDVEYYAGVWRQLRDAYGSTDMADEQFNKLFPAEFLLLTTQSSRNQTGGAATGGAAANQREYKELQSWAVEHNSLDGLGFFENYDDDAFLTGAQSEGYSQENYNPFARRWQRLHAPEGSTDPFREKFTPEESMRNALVKDGYRIYDQTRAAIERDLVQRGLAPGSYGYQKELDDRMGIAVDTIGEQNPQWQDEHLKRDEGRLLRNEALFKAGVNNPELGFITEERNSHALIKSIRRYLDTRDAIQNMLYQRIISGQVKDPSSTTDSVANYDLALLLAVERSTLSNESPAFRQWADRYFRNDAVSIDDAYLMERAAG